eukprot:scaffold6164_cov50-Phaeocystis_antarctica.AAC.1
MVSTPAIQASQPSSPEPQAKGSPGQWSRSRAPEPNGWASRAGRAYGARAGGARWAREGRRAKAQV